MGDEGAEALIGLFNQFYNNQKSDIIELVGEKFERRLTEEFGKLRLELKEDIAALRAEMNERYSSSRQEMQ